MINLIRMLQHSCLPVVRELLYMHTLALLIGLSTTEPESESDTVLSVGAIAGIISGVIGAACCCCCIICTAIICSLNSKYHSTNTTRTPRTVNVAANRATPRTTASPATAAVTTTMCTETEMFMYKPQQEPPSTYPQAQTCAGETPPDYHLACNYPKEEAFNRLLS